jgi:hypothetical protein
MKHQAVKVLDILGEVVRDEDSSSKDKAIRL